jgi:hypothetical protein
LQDAEELTGTECRLADCSDRPVRFEAVDSWAVGVEDSREELEPIKKEIQGQEQAKTHGPTFLDTTSLAPAPQSVYRRATSHHMPLPLPYNIATPLNRQSKVHNPAQRTSLTRKIGSGWRSGTTDLARLNPVIETNH